MPHCLRHARHTLRCLAGVMNHLCGSRSTRRPIVSFHFIPTGVRFLHVSGDRERGSPLRLSASRFDPSGQRSFWQTRWGENGSRRVLLLASFISCGWLPNTIAQTNLCRCGTSVTLARKAPLSFQPLERDIENQSTPADRWTPYRCNGWAWTRLEHPQSRGDEARAETTHHFILSPTKRSKNAVDLAGEPLLADLLGSHV